MVKTGKSGDGLTELELNLVFSLGDGSETTLLLLEMVNDRVEDGVSSERVEEEEIRQALSSLELQGCASQRVEHHDGGPEPGTGVPEYEQGRPEVVWWDLTVEGGRRLQEEVERRGWPNQPNNLPERGATNAWSLR